MKTVSKFYLFGILTLLLLCYCAATANEASVIPATELPADVTMNRDAGVGNWMFVTLHLEDGEALPFFIDTGAASSFFNKSLTAKLGAPLAGKYKSPRYPAPKLFLGDVQLKTGDYVGVKDFTNESAYAGQRIMGVLGIDCLKHYCIQLDFEAGKIRFLDPNHLETTSLGQAFPLSFAGEWHQPVIRNCNLVEAKGKPTLIDSGYADADGTLNTEQFAAAIRDGDVVPNKKMPGRASLPQCLWNGETHTNLVIAKASWNAIGLLFLARHLVTLNFPEQVVYLKQTRTGPFVSEDLDAGLEFLKGLKEKDQLPGWTKDDHGQLHYFFGAHSNALIFTSSKNGDSLIYHYAIARASNDGPWKLQKAWQTDKNDKMIQEFPVQ
jgi:hypothetical protein